MSFTPKLVVAAVAALIALPAFAEGILVHDAYARTSVKGAKSGAAFMHIMNQTGEDDRLVSVSSNIAKKTELHTHQEISDGVMRMIHMEDGFEIPAGGMHMLKRGGDHVMFMGLTQDMEAGETVEVTLTFEKAGDIVVQVPVDLERQDHASDEMDHSKHGSKHSDDH